MGGCMNNINSNTAVKQQILNLIQGMQSMSQEERIQLFELLRGTAQTSEVTDITEATKEQQLHALNSAEEKFKSDSVNKDEASNAAYMSANFVNSAEIQDKINGNKNGLGKLADKFKTLSPKNKLLLGGGVSAAALATPLLPVIALVALTVAVLGLGGMAIGKSTIKAGKAVAHGAQVVGKATVHGVQIAGNAVKSGAEATKRKMSDAAEIISEKGENIAKRTKHGFKNAIDHVSLHDSNIEKFLENASKFSREYGSLSSKSENQVYFIEKYLLQDGKISDKKVQALENVLNNEVNEFEVQNFHRLMEKGKSTHRGDYEEFKNQLNGLTSIMNDKEIQDAFTKELAKVGEQERKSEIKEEKAEKQPSSSFVANMGEAIRVDSIAAQRTIG